MMDNNSKLLNLNGEQEITRFDLITKLRAKGFTVENTGLRDLLIKKSVLVDTRVIPNDLDWAEYRLKNRFNYVMDDLYNFLSEITELGKYDLLPIYSVLQGEYSIGDFIELTHYEDRNSGVLIRLNISIKINMESIGLA